MEWIGYLVLGFAGLRWLVAAGNWLSRPVLPTSTMVPPARVSILVPARNEEKNLPALLAQLKNIGDDSTEILILDDSSEDGTLALLTAWQSLDPRLRVLQGAPLPQGWLGKHWACHQLALEARGDYFLFLDADIAEISPGLIPALQAYSQTHNTTLISLFPDQIMVTAGEKIVVPIMHELLLSLLPLWFILRFRFPSMSAANGQCMWMEAKQYRANLWHEQVRRVVVEDIAIMERVKASGLKGMTFVGSGWIRCRMYGSFGEAVAGFSKNLLAGFKGSVAGLTAYLFLISAGWLAVWQGNGTGWLLAGCAIVLSRRLFISLLSGQSPWQNLLLHPAQMAAMLYIGARSVILTFAGTQTWKGRKVA